MFSDVGSIQWSRPIEQSIGENLALSVKAKGNYANTEGYGEKSTSSVSTYRLLSSREYAVLGWKKLSGYQGCVPLIYIFHNTPGDFIKVQDIVSAIRKLLDNMSHRLHHKKL